MRGITEQIRKLLNALADPNGTTLDPDDVIEQIAAIRERRITVIPAEPRIVREEWTDWSDLNQVPIAALGLRVGIYRKLVSACISTVGQLIAHSAQGLRAAGASLGRYHMRLLVECLAAHNLQLAKDNTQVPIELILQPTHPLQLNRWWPVEDQRKFAEALGLRVLRDVSRLSLQQVETVPFNQYPYIGGDPDIDNLDPAIPSDVKAVVNQINRLLQRYNLPLIPLN